MRTDVFELFDEYAANFARGERPDVGAYLDRAGDARDELAGLIDAYLERVPPPEPDEASIELARAWLAKEPPLLELRKARRLRVDEVVEQLIRSLGLHAKKERKIKRYYQDLEGGILDPRGVDRSVWETLAALLHANIRDLMSWRARPPEYGLPAAFRSVDAAVVLDRLTPGDAPLASGPEPEPLDEIDRLFTGRA